MPKRVLLVVPTRTYRAKAFLEASRRLDLELVVASEESSTLGRVRPGSELVIDLVDPAEAARVIGRSEAARNIDAVIPVDDGAVLAAARIAEILGLPGSPVAAVEATRNKLILRRVLGEAGVTQPDWWLWDQPDPPRGRFPAVIKPLDQAASTGVIRVDDRAQLIRAGARVRQWRVGERSGPGVFRPLLVEEFVPGPEVAVEALMLGGAVRVLAVYDKPESLDGPFFEETIYTVPSELGVAEVGEVTAALANITRALGLSQGPIHAELRLGGGSPQLIDLASRTIGGRCSAVLQFRSGRTLEEIVLLAALAEDPGDLRLKPGPRGVMMMPIPRPGTLRSVPGRDRVLSQPGIDGVEMTVPLGGSVVPLPEGDRYLGFIFAHGESSRQVADRLRTAYEDLAIVITD